MKVNNGFIRPYSERSTQSFVGDLQDGFFPSELKEAHPDGLYIHAIDLRCLKNRGSPPILVVIRNKKKKQSALSWAHTQITREASAEHRQPSFPANRDCGGLFARGGNLFALRPSAIRFHLLLPSGILKPVLQLQIVRNSGFLVSRVKDDVLEGTVLGKTRGKDTYTRGMQTVSNRQELVPCHI